MQFTVKTVLVWETIDFRYRIYAKLQYSFVKNSNFHGVLFLSPKGRMLTLSLPTTQHYEERESVYDAFRAEK